jgi:hypothetical protein
MILIQAVAGEPFGIAGTWKKAGSFWPKRSARARLKRKMKQKDIGKIHIYIFLL